MQGKGRGMRARERTSGVRKGEKEKREDRGRGRRKESSLPPSMTKQESRVSEVCLCAYSSA